MNTGAADFLLLPKAILLLAGLIVPGAALARALRVPALPATCFAGSAVALYGATLGLTFAHAPLALSSYAAVLTTITVALLLVAWKRGAPLANEPAGWLQPLRRMGAWTPLYVVFCAIVVARACREPLAGVDHEFRWSFLAEQMLRQGSLGFYPPQTADDFLKYFWVESIPPGVASLDAWCYACGGSFAAGWTVPVVLLQFWALQDLLWRAGHALGGERAARFACLAGASCALLTWTVLLAQETGLTTLALLGIVVALLERERSSAVAAAALVAIFAALGASAREYGLVLPVIAALGLLAARVERRAWRTFLLIAIPLAALWPLRVAVLTGNPFYSLRFGALPINARFVAIVDAAAEPFAAPLHSFDGWRTIARYAASYAPAALLGLGALVVGVAHRRRRDFLFLLGIALFVALWLASVRYTTGGLFYSMRVAAPAFALAAVAGGAWLAGLSATRVGNVVVALLVLAALPATLALPQNPFRTPWREWTAFAPSPPPTELALDPLVTLVREQRAPGVVLSDAAGYQRRFARIGCDVAPLWSPQADWLFDASLTPAEAVQRWRASGIRYVALASLPGNRAGFDYLRARAAWLRPPFRWRKLGESNAGVLFAVELE